MDFGVPLVLGERQMVSLPFIDKWQPRSINRDKHIEWRTKRGNPSTKLKRIKMQSM